MAPGNSSAEYANRLQAVTAALSGSLTSKEVAAVIMEQGVPALGAGAGAVLTLAPEGDSLELLHSVGYSEALQQTYRRVPLDAPLPISHAVSRRRPIFLESKERAVELYPGLADTYARSGNNAWAALPLALEGRVMGALALSFVQSRHFLPADRAFVTALADQCAQALDRARLRDAENAAQEALRVSEARFRTIMEQSPMGIQVFSLDGTCLSANRAWEQLWGITRDKLQGYNILRDPHLVAAGLMPLIRRGFGGEVVTIPPTKYRPPGASTVEPRWLEAYLYPVRDDQDHITEIVLKLQDVTARVETERSLRESEARMRAILDATPDVVFRLDREGRSLDYRASQDDPLYVPSDQITGRALGEVLPEDVARTALEQVQKTLESGRTHMYEYQLQLGDERRDFEARVVVSGQDEVLCTVRDITEGKRAEEALRRSQEQLRAIIDNSTAVIYVKDREGRYLLVNRRFEDVFQRRGKQVLGQTDDTLFPSEVAQRLRENDRAVLRSRAPL
ncbi:MAG: PAS domain-containing protein, partial [Chloroflexota bacterium]|nr:PAS domain-containing protein [Chloroflexota bacterium]